VESMTNQQVNDIADNAWLKLAGRVLMTLAGLFIVPMTIGMWSWAAATSEDLDLLRTRVVVLENNTARGREDRVAFQDQTTAALAEILKAVHGTNERMAKIEAKLEAQQRELDRRTP
jgi:uncharacterized coiled-coil protein SlyX